MSKKQDAFYFDNFMECAQAACRAAELLKNVMLDFKPEEIDEKLSQLHEIEHRADDLKHQLTDRVSKAFITPIEREDIVMLSQNIDEVTDKIEDVLIRVYINNVTVILPEAEKLLETVNACCQEMGVLMREFRNFRHLGKLKEIIIKINSMEEEADQLYIENMRKLHTQSTDPLHIIAWREIYDYLEKCADACEHVANVVESIMMKNT